MQNLSETQMRIGRLVALGYSNREVAAELATTEQAVKSALHTIFDKLGVWNRVEFANRMLQHEPAAVVEQSHERIEAGRLEEVQALQILDSAAEVLFDEITSHLTSFFHVPMALVGLMDSERLWFKSQVGLNASEVPREFTICHHTIQRSGVNAISDASKVPLFVCNPLVAQFGVRFYAAAPILSSDGYALGVVCIIDHVARNFKDSDLSLLTSYARIASRQLELRREFIALKQFGINKPSLAHPADDLHTSPDERALGETA